ARVATACIPPLSTHCIATPAQRRPATRKYEVRRTKDKKRQKERPHCCPFRPSAKREPITLPERWAEIRGTKDEIRHHTDLSFVFFVLRTSYFRLTLSEPLRVGRVEWG